MVSGRRGPRMWGLLAVLTLGSCLAGQAAASPTIAVALSACAPVYDGGWKVSCTATVSVAGTTNVSAVSVFLDKAAYALDPATATGTATACTIAGPVLHGTTASCTANLTLDGTEVSPLALSASANATNDAASPATVATTAFGNTSVALGRGSITVAPLQETAAGSNVTATVGFTNNGPVNLTVGSVTPPSGWVWSSNCPPATLSAGTGGSPATVTCTAVHLVDDADLDGAGLQSWTFGYAAPELNAAVTAATATTLPRSATISASITGCALSQNRPAAQAALTCTATVKNTGTMRLKGFSVTAPSACTFAGTAADAIAAGANKTCSFTQPIPWANFTVEQNVTVAVAASASVFTTATLNPAPAAPAASSSILYTASPVSGLALVQMGITPATVNASGTTAVGNFTLANTGTLNLTRVTYNATSANADPRVAAIALYCAGLAQNGTLPAGSSLVQCTETLNFQNVTFIEGGDVVFNVTAYADGGVFAATTQTVAIRVDNTPSLTLELNTTKCGAPAPVAKAGNPITCSNAVVLTNTGKVRLDVDDIVVGSTIGVQLATCTQTNAVGNINLTAVNATLLPGDKLVCSFSIVPSQVAYEQGAILFDVNAMGVAAYGTHPAINGISGGVVPANRANITLPRLSNVTIASSVIGSVKQDGDTVTYKVVVSNQGNIVLRNINLATNLPNPTWYIGNLTDGLDVGEVVTLSSNITFNKTMIRAGNASLSTNVSAASVAANVSAASFATILTPWCQDNRTVAPTDHIRCRNNTECGDGNLRCDLTTLTPRYTCYGGAVDVSNDYGQCVHTPCRKCQLCLAAVDGFFKDQLVTTDATATDATLVANKFLTYCQASMLNANRTADKCQAAANATRDSFQGNAGKRAAVICRNMGECDPAGVGATCKLGTTTSSGAAVVPEGALDLCIPSGTNATNQPPVLGVVLASAPFAKPTCQVAADCNATETVCLPPPVGTLPAKHVVCNPATGADTVTDLGTCQPTPCRRCRECFADMKKFADSQKTQTVPTGLSAAFRSQVCAAAPSPYSADACALAALAIEASLQGNMGKRPAQLCSLVGACSNTLDSSCIIQANTSTAPTLTADMQDRCTTDGLPYAQGGALVTSSSVLVNAADNATMPNVTAAADGYDCYDDAGCAYIAADVKCSFATTKQWCQCQSGNGSEACTPIGKCVQTATCSNCAKCVAAVGPFVKAQQASDAGTVAAAWAQQAGSILAAMGSADLVQKVDVAAVQQAILGSPGGLGNVGKRAGALCTQMQFCVKTMAGVGGCGMNVSVTSANETYVTGQLDLCSVEGIPYSQGAAKVKIGAADNSSDVPFNTCNQISQNDRCAPGYTCDLTKDLIGSTCTCDAATGAEVCTKYAACVKTPCKRCSDCLAHIYAFTSANMFSTSATIKADLAAHCGRAYSGQACKSALDAISPSDANVNGLKRAGLVCSKLAECDASTITGGCTLAVTPALNSTDNTVDLCTVAGISGGTDLPGTSSNGLPAGMCDTVANCPDQTTFYCDKNATWAKDFSLCTRTVGVDSVRKLGACRLMPHYACQQCLADFKDVVAAAGPVPTPPEALADAFFVSCMAGKGRPAAACSAAAQGIATSFKGNTARRGGAICLLLQECKPAYLSSMQLSPGAGIAPGTFSNCTTEGTSAGSSLGGFPVNPDRSSFCTSDAACNVTGQFCSMTAAGSVAVGQPGSCSCSESTGLDACIPLGKCVDTPCNKCQKCITQMRDTRNTSAPAFSYSDLYSAKCQPSFDTCDAVRLRYFGTPVPGTPASYYFALRAGAVCTALQQCMADKCALKATTIASPAQNITGAALDMCTAEGVAGGTQLKNVLVAGNLPPAGCLADGDCATGLQCDLKNSTTFYTCSGGRDTSTTYGRCVAKPTLTGTPQQRCSACLAAVRPLVNDAAANMSLTGSTLASSFYSACSGAGYPLVDCTRVQAAVAASRGGWLARRAGALCARLGECSATGGYTVTANYSALSPKALQPSAPAAPAGNAGDSNSTNATVPSPSPAPAASLLVGAVDTCTIEGVVGGTSVPGSLLASDKSPNATCVLDAECGAGQYCSSDDVIPVCRCVDGMDSCDSLATCKPIPAAASAPPGDTRSDCDKCKDCLSAVRPWIAATAMGSNNSLQLASLFVQNCTGSMTANDVVKCRAIAGAIAFSLNGNLAKRAGAICSRLGNCSAEAASSRCNVTATARLDVCTQEGFTAAGGGMLVFNTGADNTTCAADSDCGAASGKVCSKANPTKACTCRDGTDVCQLVGTCVDFCGPQQDYIAAVNRALPKCDSPFAQCGTGLQCVASPQCKQLSCSPSTGITITQCYGLCTPATRTLLGATLSDDGRSITVGLNTPAGEASFPCRNVLDTATNAKIGQSALCSVAGQKLAVSLARDASIMPGDSLVLSASQGVLVDAIDPTAKFATPATAIALGACSDCAAPVVVIAGPKSVPEPCDASSAADVVFDGSFSMDGMGRPLTKYSWDQTQADKDVVLSTAIAAANSGVGSPRLVIPGSALDKISDGTYTLRLTAANFLGISSSADATFVKLGKGTTPVVSVLGGDRQAFTVAEGIKVSAKLLPSSVCANKKVEWRWVSPGWAAIPAGYNRKDLVIPGPVVDASGEKTVSLLANFADSPGQVVNVTITLVPVASPIKAVLRGPSGDVRADRVIVLNASSSVDPDDPKNSEPFAITWSCTREDFPSPCFTGMNYGVQSGLAWAIDGTLLAAGKQHTFTAEVQKGGRRDVASIVVKPTTTAIPTGRIVRKCGSAACPARHNADKDLALSVELFAGSDGATPAWSSDQVASMDKFGTKTDITIGAAALPTSGTVTVSAALANGVGSSKTSITVPINGRPACSIDAGCLSVTTVSATFPAATFNLEAKGFTDDMPGLSYDFGIQTAGAYTLLASGPSPTLTVTGLPVGATTLYVCAVDADGAQLCQSTSVTVAPAAAGFKVSDALTSFNVSQLEGSGDVGVLAAGAQTLSSLSKFAGSGAVSQTADEKKQVAAALAVKVNALIKTLSKNVDSYLDDPQTMKQIVSTTGIVLATTSDLSSDSRAKGKKVSQAGITSAKISPDPLDPRHASQLLGVYAIGSGAAAAKSSSSSGARRHLLASEVFAPATGRGLLQSNGTASPSPSPAPAAPAAPSVFVPAYQQTALDVAALLLRGATPATGFLSSGSNGLYVTVVNQLGRGYSALNPALAVGPALVQDGSKADASDKANVRISVANLVGACTDADGATLTADGSCAVPVTAIYTPDASGALNAAGSNDQLPSGLAPVSGAVALQAGAAASGSLPCAAAGCTATLTLPVTEAANVTQLYKCVHVVDGVAYIDAAVAPTAASRAIDSTSGAFTYTCAVTQAGTYLVGKYADPSYKPPAQGVPALATYDNITGYEVGKPVYAQFEFAMKADFNFDTFINDQAEVASFKAAFKGQLAKNLQMKEDSITITNLYQGSIIVEATFDTSDLNAAQLSSFVGSIQYRPDILFDSAFQARFGITGVTAKVLAPPAAPGPNIAAIVGGVVGGVGGALLVGGVAYFIIRKRRAAGVEPRNRGLLADEHDV